MVKKNPCRTTNLDFPSVLLNQGLTEANNNTQGGNFRCLFSQTRRKKEGKKERRKERKQTVITLLRARHDAVCLLVNTFRHKTTFARERALHTTRETTRVYKNTITNDEIVTTHTEENKHRSLFKRAKQREKEEKHFKIERERSLKSAQSDLDLDVPIDRIEEV